MPHSAEGEAFLERLAKLPEGPGVSLDDVLKVSIDEEQELRKLFVQEKDNPRLDNPHVGLVDAFGPNTDTIRKTRARVIKDEEDLSARYVMPLKEAQRKKEGEACMVGDIDEFKKNWAIFTEGSLSQLFDWNNVVAAGGAVLSALLPLPEENKKSKRAIRKFYHSSAYPTSDVDLFLWGLTPEQAEKKIVTIYEAVRDSVPWDVTCIRTKHTVSIHSQYPYRSVQIVLRLYRSPAEILAGFDVDAPCCIYDGERVWANPRAIVAMMRQCNTVDITRRSPSYEIRLAKYSKRGFEVYVPNLVRKNIDPTIYERSIVKIEGLARLLVLEKLLNSDSRNQFLESRRKLRGRPFALRQKGGRKKRKYKGDLKTDIGGLEMNDYDVTSLHIPYGPGWDARRIEKLVYQTDLGMNSTFNPKNKGRRLHRHPAFFGTVEECVEDCCENCPEPIDDDERNLQKNEDEMYIRGRISFIEENPGRQSLSGSFNPINEGEWSEQVYVRPLQRLFNAIISHDRDTVKAILEEGKIDLKNRDHVGRTALHLAILTKNADIAGDLMDAGCRMIARLADGRTALHLAAQYDMHELIGKMLAKSKVNAEAAKQKKGEKEEEKDEMQVEVPPETTADEGRPSSEDDWSSDESGGTEDADAMDVDADEGEGSNKDSDDYDHCDDSNPNSGGRKDAKTEITPDGEVPEDEESEPDVLDVNAGDWDQGFTPLCYAVLYASPATVDVLLKNEANPNEAAVSKGSTYDSRNYLPLFLALLRDDEGVAAEIAERLLEAGASSSSADDKLMTIIHYAVFAGRAKLLDVMLRKDPGAKRALDFPSVYWGASKFPIVSAIRKGSYAVLATLLAHGTKINPTGADVTRAKTISGTSDGRIWGYAQDYSTQIYRPVETALSMSDYVVEFLIELGAELDVGLYQARRKRANPEDKMTILDWVNNVLEDQVPERIKAQEKLYAELEEKAAQRTYVAPARIKTWKEYLADFAEQLDVIKSNSEFELENVQKQLKQAKETLEGMMKTRGYLSHVKSLLESRGAKTWEEVHGTETEDPCDQKTSRPVTRVTRSGEPTVQPKPRYKLLAKGYRNEYVQQDSNDRYDELFEAAFKGDDAKIEKLCTGDSSDGSVVPIQVAVEAILPTKYDMTMENRLSLLFAAIAGKRWSTAKFIMGIAAAQYKEEGDEEEDEVRAALFNLVDEEDEDMSDNDSDYSDDTVDARRRQTKFVDIAKKISVRTKIHPSTILGCSFFHPVGNELNFSTLITKFVRENNFEAFVKLFDIYNSTVEVTEESPLFQAILYSDKPKFLDELIKRTGVGIDVDSLRQSAGENHPNVLNDQNRLYLGLNIHGKKRADLARKGDPSNYVSRTKRAPLVWGAASAGAQLVLEYLASEKPLAAYKYFATNGTDDRAEWLRHSKNLDASLSEWLGWTITPLGESPLTMAVLNNRGKVLPTLFAKAGKLMGSALNQRIKFLGFNALLLAANRACDKETFDFLLKKSASPLESDQLKGWNMYHWLCSGNHGDLLEYLLGRLPREVSEELLAQRSKGRLHTPLQVAIDSGCTRLVKLILSFTQQGLLEYDAIGFTPLHNAVRIGYRSIVDEILKVIPQEGLYLENGVGKTPYEDAEKRALKPLTESIFASEPPVLDNFNNIKQIHSDEVVKEELQKVPQIVKQLIDNGTLQKDAPLANALEKFVSTMEGRLARARVTAASESDNTTSPNQMDRTDQIGTFKSIAKAVAGGEAKRKLIHLKDVQSSVAQSLREVYREEKVYASRDGFEEEEDNDSKEKEKGFVFSYVTINEDTMYWDL